MKIFRSALIRFRCVGLDRQLPGLLYNCLAFQFPDDCEIYSICQYYFIPHRYRLLYQSCTLSCRRPWQRKAARLFGLGAVVHTPLMPEQVPLCPELCGALSRLWLAHAKLGLKQRDIFNPYDVGECSVQPTGGTEGEVRCHLLKFAAKSHRGKNQRCFNISRETREITTGLKSCRSMKLPKKNNIES